MKKLLQRLLKFVAYAAAGVVILLAIAVGLFRLFLPRLPEYQEDIKGWASAAIGMNVEFSGMDARWGLSGPELEFYDAELISTDTMARIIAADEVSIGVGLMRLLSDRKLVVDRVVVRDTSLEVRQLENGQWWIQGSPPGQLLPKRRAEGGDTGGHIQIIGEDIEIQFMQPGDERPRVFRVPSLVASRDDSRLAIDANVELPDDLGGRLTLRATQVLVETDAPPGWDVTVEANDLRLGGVSALYRGDLARFESGRGDLELSMVYADDAIRSATADVDFRNVAVAGNAGFSINSHFEFRNDVAGWLVAANDFQLKTTRGAWPATSLRVEAGTGVEGQLVTLDARASYINIGDTDILAPWLTAEQNVLLAKYAADGVIRDVDIMLGEIDSEAPLFDVSAEFFGVGVAAIDNGPGVRGFSGRLRADRSGGRLEFDSAGMSVNAPKYLGQPAVLDDATGTIIWRQSNNRTTVLSDSIVIRNADFDLEMNVEVVVTDDGAAPIVDLAGVWSIADLSSAKNYVPFLPRIPRTSEWLQEGLLAGRVPRGTVRLYGPLDKFPFDNGEGRLFIEANVRDARIMYQRRWPVAEIIDLDMAVENTRLYSERNRIVSVGNEVTNARLEIGDFRSPVLKIQADSTGTLDSVRRLMAQSPIGEDVFGGKLDRVAVSGSGSFSIDLSVPIRDWKSFEFTSRLQTSGATLQLEGFPAPVTDLGGVITVQREDISSNALGGLFLGQPVAIELMAAPETMPELRAIATATGSATAEALKSELGLPFGDFVAGQTNYEARLLFPRGKVQQPRPFAIEINTDLTGLALDWPAPLQKLPDDAIPITATIELPAGGERIDSSGLAQDFASWRANFVKTEGQWDLDRGVITLGGEETTEIADTRGFHLRGRTDSVRLQDWLDLSSGNDRQTGMGERIRSIDMTFGNLHVVGQHLVDHHIRVDRSARDWLIEIDGDDIVGSAVVPYDFRSGRTLSLDMQRLVLPGEEPGTDTQKPEIDPRALPPVSVKAAEFAFGDRFLGAVEAEFQHTVDGLESTSIVAKDATFDIVGTGGWVIDESDPEGHRSYVTAALTSRNLEKTMQRLAYDPGIAATDLSMLLEFSWSGGPREDFMDSLDGLVKVRIGSGQLNEVEPGAGRMFGLMSIVALPRRLALDFRDVFSKGFGFDEISGDFRIVDGETYTCNLSLKGPAADIGIVGRAGLVSRDYDQMAVVSANFGNTLPMVGAVVGGPQVAAVLLVFSQIFKKPLQEVSQVYYGVGGSWDEPLIDSASAEAFADLAIASGCIEK